MCAKINIFSIISLKCSFVLVTYCKQSFIYFVGECIAIIIYSKKGQINKVIYSIGNNYSKRRIYLTLANYRNEL